MQPLFTQIISNLISAAGAKFDRAIELSPYILGALAVLLFGFLLAELAARVITGLGHKIRLEFLCEKIGLKHFLERQNLNVTPSQVVAHGVRGYLIFLFAMEAAKIAKLTQIAEFFSKVISYIPEVLIALFIMLIGIHIGHTLQIIITTSLSFARDNTAKVLGFAAKYTIVTFAVLAALSQLQIAEILIDIMFIGFIAFLALAGGLAFGLGGKDVVRELLEDVKKVELKEIRKEIKAELKRNN